MDSLDIYLKKIGVLNRDVKKVTIDFSLGKKDVISVDIDPFFHVMFYKYYTLDNVKNHSYFMFISGLDMIIIEKKMNDFINLDTGTTIDLSNKRGFFIVAETVCKKFNEKEFLRHIIKLTPKSYMFTGLFTIFVLLVPIYSNLFNTKLIYNDSYNSVFFISLLFFIFVFIEYFLKINVNTVIKKKTCTISMSLNKYLAKLPKYVDIHNYQIKYKSLESSAISLWSNIPLLYVDIISFTLLTMLIFIILGFNSFILLGYNLLFCFVLCFVRFKSYKDVLRSSEINSELYERIHSINDNRISVSTYSDHLLDDYIEKNVNASIENRFKIEHNNSSWSEIIKLNSFFSIFILFSIMFFSVKSDPTLWTYSIVLLLANGRISGLVSSISSRAFSIVVSVDSIKDGYKSIGENFRGIKNMSDVISKIEYVDLINFGSKLIDHIGPINLKLIQGNIYTLSGGVGSGKSSLLRCLTGIGEYDGEILFNNISINNISDHVMHKYIGYLSAENYFLKGTLVDNFKMRGVLSSNMIMTIVNAAIPNSRLSYEDLFVKDWSELNLSSGEIRRLNIEIMLSVDKYLILLDEPTANLSAKDSYQFITKIKSISTSKIIIIATHDPYLLKSFEANSISLGTSSDKFGIKLN